MYIMLNKVIPKRQLFPWALIQAVWGFSQGFPGITKREIPIKPATKREFVICQVPHDHLPCSGPIDASTLFELLINSLCSSLAEPAIFVTRVISSMAEAACSGVKFCKLGAITFCK